MQISAPFLYQVPKDTDAGADRYSETMHIPGVLNNRIHLSLVLIYVISAAALCCRVPTVDSNDFSDLGGVTFDGNTAVGLDDKPSPQRMDAIPSSPPENKHAPLWALGSGLSLNRPLFAAEQAVLFGLLVIVALIYRCRARLAIWAKAFSASIHAKRRGTCIWLGFAVILLLSLFPPWVEIETYGGLYPSHRLKLWHAPLFRAPIEATRSRSSEVDYARMLTEIAVGESFIFALYFTWARPVAGNAKN